MDQIKYKAVIKMNECMLPQRSIIAMSQEQQAGAKRSRDLSSVQQHSGYEGYTVTFNFREGIESCTNSKL